MAVIIPVISKFDDKGLKQAQSQFGAFGSSMKKLLGGAAILAGLNAVSDGVKSVVSSASNLSEVQAAVGQVFGSASTTLEDFAKTAASTMGMSQTQFLDAAKTFGVFGKAAGLADQDNAQFSSGLTQLASDLASFNNTSTADAISALGAGLRGESEPLRRYGVMLSDAVLKARAMEMGIYSGTGALTTQQKILASQAEIMAQTGTQQGDFARTSDGLANSTRILTATFEDMKAVVGQAVAPAMATLAQAITPVVTALGPVLNALVAALNPIFESLPTLIDAILPPFMSLISLVGDLVSQVLPPLLEIFMALVPVLDPLITVFKTLIDAILPPLTELISKVLVPILMLVVDILNKFVLPYVDDLAKALGEVLTEAVTAVIEVFDLLKSAFEPIIQAFKDLQKDTGIDFMAILKSLNPALIALQALAKGLAIITFTIKMARAAAMGDWAAVAKLTAEGPFAAMEQRAKDAAAQRGQDAAGSRLQAQADAWKAAQDKKNPPKLEGFQPPPVVQEPGDNKKALAAAKKKAAAEAKALKEAADQIKKSAIDLYESSQKAYNEQISAIDDMKKSMQGLLSAVKPLPLVTEEIGSFQQSAIDSFDEIGKSITENSAMFKDGGKSLLAYVATERNAIQAIAKQRDELANRYSLAKAVKEDIAGSIVAMGNLTDLLQSQTETVTQTISTVVDGISVVRTKTFEQTKSSGDIVSGFKAILDKAKTFAKSLTELKKLGLNGTLFKQIVDSGADAGTATADAIIAGGASAVTELNSTFTDLQAVGADIGEQTATVMYGAGIDLTNGLLEGIKSKEQELMDTATAMATAFTTAFNSVIAKTVIIPTTPQLADNYLTQLTNNAGLKKYVQNSIAGLSGSDLTNQLDMLSGANVSQAGSFMNSLGYMGANGPITVNVNAGVISDKATLPQIIVDALGTYTKQSGAGGLTRVLGL